MDIKSLKDKILQLAIQGKLVAQDENDEPASVLLERIKAEKEQLIKDKIIKKEKPLPEISDEEKSFDLPKGWKWVRLIDLYRFIDYRGKTPNKIDSGIPFITAKNVRMGFIDYTVQDFISEEEYNDRQTRGISRKGDLLFTTEAPMGNVAIADLDKFSAGQRLITLQQYTSDILIDNQLFMYFIMSKMFQNQLLENKTGTTVYGIKAEKLKKLLLPLPPLEEQKRIVAKVDELFELIDELDNNKQELLENISNTRNKVLQLAIQGKLVDQCEDDEPASVLLERIKAEKEQLVKDKVIKKEKTLPEISEEDKVFNLPKGWEWCRLGQISHYIKAGGDKPKDFSADKNEEYKIPVIANGKTNTGIVGYTKIATENNVCITVSGRGTIGYSCIRKEPFCPIVRLIVIRPSASIDISYLNYALHHFVEQGVGTSIQQLTVPMIKPKVIPIPPLEEQKRIVEKVDLMMDYLDALQQEIESQEIILKDILQ